MRTDMLDVSLKFSRGSFALDLQFAAPAGSIVALFGPSGCGKSTTANLLAGLLTPLDGHIRVNDEVLFDAATKTSIHAEQRSIGYVFQQPRLFPHFNVAANLRFGLKRSRSAHFIDFDSVVHLLDLQSMLQRHPNQLSGGEQQRVAIGRALLSQPALLLLDEPLASLDVARRNEVLPYLERLRDVLRIPIVYISHQFDEVLQLATHVVLMNHGRCIAQGDLPTISLCAELRSLIGAEAIGAIVDGIVHSIDDHTGLAHIAVGKNFLLTDAQQLVLKQPVRLQLLARDLIISLDNPQRLSIRNRLHGIVVKLEPDDQHSVLLHIDIGGVQIMARITTAACEELHVQTGMNVWVLVKAVTLRGHVFPITKGNSR
ncbi:MAG TPA: molybdenum ABC transporter ATP-binding protein [Steroidobacteraceae bacterium]|nr:molybdenum ABC transporter ATP-binding protein [Steroidobacteraceae bacterium]